MIANCARCGRFFDRTIRDICKTCIEEEAEFINIIRAYLKENKMATITDVVRDTDIDLEIVLDLIEDGFIVLVDNPNINFECSRCGLPTQDGRICAHCRDELVRELANATHLVRNVKESSDKQKKVIYHSLKSEF